MKKLFVFFCSLMIIFMASSFPLPAGADAASLVVNSSGILVGAEEVEVSGNLYDVMFNTDYCINIFGGCDPAFFAFTTEEEATLASQSLLDQVFIDGPAGMFDSNVCITVMGVNDCEFMPIPTGYFRGIAMTPYAVTPSGDGYTYDVWHAKAINQQIGFGEDSVECCGTWNSHLYTTYPGESAWAVWTPTSSVPEPAAIALLASGLFGLGALRKKVKK